MELKLKTDFRLDSANFSILRTWEWEDKCIDGIRRPTFSFQLWDTLTDRPSHVIKFHEDINKKRYVTIEIFGWTDLPISIYPNDPHTFKKQEDINKIIAFIEDILEQQNKQNVKSLEAIQIWKK